MESAHKLVQLYNIGSMCMTALPTQISLISNIIYPIYQYILIYNVHTVLLCHKVVYFIYSCKTWKKF